MNVNNSFSKKQEYPFPKLCFGCAAAFARNLITDEEAVELINSCLRQGINFFDTGHHYGCAEQRLGVALKNISREDVYISTKAGVKIENGKFVKDFSPEWIKESLDISLKRMGIDYVDILYLYFPRKEHLTAELFLTLNELKEQGKVHYIGINTFTPELLEYIAKEKLFDVVMLDYNIVRQDREPVIKALYEQGVTVIAGQALAEGLFSKDLFRIRSRKDLWYLLRTFGRKSSRVLYKEAKRFRFLNKVDGFDASQIALKYVLDNPYIASACFGTASFEHLKKNAEAQNIEITEDLKRRIHEASSGK